MAVWFMRSPQCLLCKQFVLFHGESPPTPEDREHQQMIVETTCCASESVRMRMR